MPSLLTIPQEIRGAILETVLLSSRPAPPDVATAAEHRLEPFSRDQLECAAWCYGPSHTRFERSDYVSNAYHLLLVNRQISEETRSAVSRLTRAGLSYKLDVMFIQGCEVWPTWWCVPSLAEQVDHVDVTLRIFGASGKTERSAFRGGDGSPPQIYWCFYFLLEHFITHGPISPSRAKTSERNKNKEFSAKTLNVTFVAGDTPLLPPTNEESSCQSYLHPQRNMHFGEEGQQDDAEPLEHIIRPEWLAMNLSLPFRGLLSMDYHGAAYGMMIHERIGSVRFFVGERKLWEVDIGARLASLSFGPHPGHTRYTTYTFGHIVGEDRLHAFWHWKEGAVRKRRERGLPVPNLVVMPAPQELLRLQQPIHTE